MKKTLLNHESCFSFVQLSTGILTKIDEELQYQAQA
jgi:hypothetical protein